MAPHVPGKSLPSRLLATFNRSVHRPIAPRERDRPRPPSMPQQDAPPPLTSRDLEVALARDKSLLGAAATVVYLYLAGFFPGLIFSALWLREAYRIREVTGRTPSGTGCLWTLLAGGILAPMFLLVLLLVIPQALSGLVANRLGRSTAAASAGQTAPFSTPAIATPSPPRPTPRTVQTPRVAPRSTPRPTPTAKPRATPTPTPTPRRTPRPTPTATPVPTPTKPRLGLTISLTEGLPLDRNGTTDAPPVPFETTVLLPASTSLRALKHAVVDGGEYLFVEAIRPGSTSPIRGWVQRASVRPPL